MDSCLVGFSAPMNEIRVDGQSDLYQNNFEQPIEDPNFMDLPLLPPPYPNSYGLSVAPPSAPMNEFRVDDPYPNSYGLSVAPPSAHMNEFRVDDQYDFYQNIGNGLRFEEPIEDPNFSDLPSLPPYANSCSLPVAPPSDSMNGFGVDDQYDFYQNIGNVLRFEEPIEDPNFRNLPLLLPYANSSSLPVDPPSVPMNGFRVDDRYDFYQNIGNGLRFVEPIEDPKDLPLLLPQANSCVLPVAPPSDIIHVEDYTADCVFSDCVLKYINQVLMEEDMEEQTCMVQEFSALQAAEKPFYEILGQKYPPSPDGAPFQESISQFRRGVKEASKFLPNVKDLILDLEKGSKSKGRKHLHLHGEETELEEVRSNKQLAVYTEEVAEHKEMFDTVLLTHPGGKGEVSLENFRESLKNGKLNDKKQRGRKKKVVDLSALLMNCAQAVAIEDRKTAIELLKQIRQHSTPSGDGNQRLAHYFADGIEARLAGAGRQPYTAGHSSLKKSAANVIRAYRLYIATCPFKKLSYFFSSKNILNLTEKSSKLHIIDFGIAYGFQWPSFIQILSNRPGGPPKLHITGIEFPQPGFRPSSMVEETGRRLANYAKTFNVPFEYTAISKKWEKIQLEDLKIEHDEVLVVNCLFRLKNLLDLEDMVVVDSPRNAVLNLIRKMKPNVFIHGIVNGTYNSSFFETRFRELLFQYSAMFDMLEANVGREVDERMLLERDLFARGAINVISCEGSERIERPETYKQWQFRCVRVGLKQLPLNPDIIKVTGERVKAGFHKDFGIDQDGHWVLETWKGRTIFAISCWRSSYDS